MFGKVIIFTWFGIVVACKNTLKSPSYLCSLVMDFPALILFLMSSSRNVLCCMYTPVLPLLFKIQKEDALYILSVLVLFPRHTPW